MYSRNTHTCGKPPHGTGISRCHLVKSSGNKSLPCLLVRSSFCEGVYTYRYEYKFKYASGMIFMNGDKFTMA